MGASTAGKSSRADAPCSDGVDVTLRGDSDLVCPHRGGAVAGEARIIFKGRRDAGGIR